MKLNLGCGKAIKEGYLNVDKFPLPGVDQQVDLFVFPWPWEDNTFTEVYASHLVEHIPHLVRRVPYQGAEPEPVWDEDGFFIFFREVHRILRPGGLCRIIVPFARSTGADQDPTHTRYINEATFYYLTKQDNNENFDYQLGYYFELVRAELRVPSEEIDRGIEWMTRHLWNIADEIHVDLKKPEE